MALNGQHEGGKGIDGKAKAASRPAPKAGEIKPAAAVAGLGAAIAIMIGFSLIVPFLVLGSSPLSGLVNLVILLDILRVYRRMRRGEYDRGSLRQELVAGGLPVLGSCAGLILLDRDHLGVMDITARRNAFGRQVRSFEVDLELSALPDGPVRGIFIRAPWIAEHGPQVEILAEIDGHGVAAREGALLAVAFHSELGADDRVHRLFLESVAAYAGGADRSSASQP